MILFIKNIRIEGPETLETFFNQKNIKTQTIELDQGEKLPSSLQDIDAVVILGGPMNVYEEEKHPFLKEEHIFIQKVLKEKIPYLGLCLGSQLLAKASGAKVVKSPQPEVGFSFVDITSQGEKDVLFKGIDSTCRVFQWHGDMFEMPAKASLLASSAVCPHQAFKVGANAYGLQFHVEITDQSIEEWSRAYLNLDDKGDRDKMEYMLEQYKQIQPEFDLIAQKLYNNFLEIIQQNKINI